jgi:hypothetical protein
MPTTCRPQTFEPVALAPTAIDVGSPARRATADIDFDGQSGSS